ncbi:hypothetical protein [Paenibacillus sp. 32352]|uniref:hypothetical protein n=1 Tax=Paenibacillus sp. 32352 TaxID=1969111 RepID=UPI0009AD6F39|nr:hypothetical protein [Paenibacillus sp. 32352]
MDQPANNQPEKIGPEMFSYEKNKLIHEIIYRAVSRAIQNGTFDPNKHKVKSESSLPVESAI